MNKKIVFLASVVCTFIFSAALSHNAAFAAEGDAWGGGQSGSYSPGSSGGSSGASGSCITQNGVAGSGLNASCMGYSWIYFKATGPQWKSGDNTVGHEIFFRPYAPYGGVSDPYISGICAGSDKKGNRLGFWHLGRNGTGWSLAGIFNTDNYVQGGMIGEEVAGGKRDINGNFPYAFRLYNKSSKCATVYDGEGRICALGHMATWSYNYIGGKYQYRWQLSDFYNPYRVQEAVKGGVDGAQKLYKKINGVNVEIYSSYRIASESEVFEEYKETYRIQNGGEAVYTESWFPGDLYAFCSWEFVPKYKLAAKAVDEDGRSLSSVSGLGDRDSGEIKEKQPASVSRGENSQYIFLGWKAAANSDTYITTTNTNSSSYISDSGNTFNIKSIEDNAIVYAVYREKDAFNGQIQTTSSSGSESIGFTNENGQSKTHIVENCDAVSGCEVTFFHYLRRDYGKDGTNYQISRTGTNPNNNVASGTANFNTNPDLVLSDTVTLKPGQEVCEVIKFNANDISEAVKEVTLTACASAAGIAQTTIDINVRNASVSKYTSYQKTIYAKPGDQIDFKADYNPALQYAYPLVGSQLPDWKNAFNVSGVIRNASDNIEWGSNNYIYTPGDTTVHSENIPNGGYNVTTTNVGHELIKTAKTNINNNVKTTPSKVTYQKNGNNNIATIDTTAIESSANVIVPYNFNTSVAVGEDKNSEIIDAGGSKTVYYEIDVLPKRNTVTTNNGGDDEAYATIVRNARSKVVVYVTNNSVFSGGEYNAGASDNLCGFFVGSSNCVERGDEEEYYAELSTSKLASFTLDAPDASAGSRICVAAAFYPSSSGADTNMDASGSRMWRISDSKCFVIDKKPTFQVWGGSFYGAKDVVASTTAKTSLAGVATVIEGKIVFGSWIEQSVVANGMISGLASGASTGLALSIAGGGSVEKPESFCKYRVPLSFANYAVGSTLGICSGDSGNGLAGYSGIEVNNNKELLVSELSGEMVTSYNYTSGDDEIVDFNKDGVAVRHIKNGNFIINGFNGINKTHIVRAAGSITINGNLTYANYDNPNYNSLNDIPKLVLYAGGDINIGCNVDRIDAVLIAGGTVNSCMNGGDINNAIRSRQLRINGAIFARKLELGRTYGMGAGKYSVIPAEIINYDTSVLLWGRGKTETEDYGNLHQVYINEIAPRY